MTALHVLDQAPDDRLLPRIAAANVSVDQTRTQLHKGPANVYETGAHLQTNTTHEADMGRALAQDLRSGKFPHDEAKTQGLINGGFSATAAAAAGAAHVGTGNCGEHAELSVVSHLDKLQPDQQLEVRYDFDVDHMWVREGPHGGDRSQPTIELDAWANGPAVQTQHAFTRTWNAELAGSPITHSAAAPLLAEVAHAKEVLRDNPEQVRAVMNRVPEQTRTIDHVFSQDRTVDAAFVAELAQRLDVHIEPGDTPETIDAKAAQGAANLKAAREALQRFDDTAPRAALDAPAQIKATREWAQAALAHDKPT